MVQKNGGISQWREYEFTEELIERGLSNVVERIKLIEPPVITTPVSTCDKLVELWKWNEFGDVIRNMTPGYFVCWMIFGQRIRDIILSEMDLSRELSDEEICDLIGSVVSREARDRPMTIKDRAELERTIFNSLRKLDVLQELVDDRDVTEIMVNGPQ